MCNLALVMALIISFLFTEVEGCKSSCVDESGDEMSALQLQEPVVSRANSHQPDKHHGQNQKMPLRNLNVGTVTAALACIQGSADTYNVCMDRCSGANISSCSSACSWAVANDTKTCLGKTSDTSLMQGQVILPDLAEVLLHIHSCTFSYENCSNGLCSSSDWKCQTACGAALANCTQGSFSDLASSISLLDTYSHNNSLTDTLSGVLEQLQGLRDMLNQGVTDTLSTLIPNTTDIRQGVMEHLQYVKEALNASSFLACNSECGSAYNDCDRPCDWFDWQCRGPCGRELANCTAGCVRR